MIKIANKIRITLICEEVLKDLKELQFQNNNKK